MPSLLKFTRYTTPLIVFVLLLIFFWKGLGSDPRKIPSPLVGKPMPHFTQGDLDLSSPVTSEKLFQGEVSLLNIWATWCLACHHEHDQLVDISHKKGIRVFGLNYKDTRDAARKWLDKMGNPYMACIFDPDGKLAMKLGVYGTPETFLIDKKGIVRYKHVGPIDQKVWNNELVPLIQKLKAQA